MPRLPRRCFLAGALRATALGLAAPGLLRAAGCTPAEEAVEFLRVDVSGLAPGGRLLVLADDLPVELVRTEAGISARSLLCTHQGCVVTWIELDRQYLCPCHEARFDEQGKPVYGPAKRPLHVFPVEVNGNEATVDVRVTEG